jgi:two-component sensor histidine kinase
MPGTLTTLPQLSQQTVLIVENTLAVASDLKQILEKAGYLVSGIAGTITEALALGRQQRPDLVLLDIDLNGPKTGIELAQRLTHDDIPFVYLSAHTDKSILAAVNTTQPLGFIVKPFREKDVLVALEIARYRHAHRLEVRLRKEQTLQIALTETLSQEGEWEERLLKVARLFQPHIPFDYLMIGLENEKDLDAFRSCSFYRTGRETYQTIGTREFMHLTGLTTEKFHHIRHAVGYEGEGLYQGVDFDGVCQENPLKNLIANTFCLQSNLHISLTTARNSTFLLSFYSHQPDAYLPEHLQLLVRLRPSLTLTVDRLLAFDQIKRLSEHLAELLNEKDSLLEQKDTLLWEKDQLLTEKEWLLKEIHHRVKNNLQVVMSLLSSQAASLHDKAALSAIQESQHRVQAMALIHQKLYQSEGVARIPMQDYIEEVVAYLRDSYNLSPLVRFCLSVNPVQLDVTLAVPLGLIINEAITNAFKYAFPGGRPGTISLSLHRRPGTGYELVISDDGVGLPAGYDPSRGRSLGMTLMHGFSEQLGGTLSIRSRGGLSINLVFAEEQLVRGYT